MKKIVSIILLILPVWVAAQSLSIEQLWGEMSKNKSLQQRQVETAIKQEELSEQKRTRIPVFYIDANLQHNLIIPTTPVPAIAFDPTAPDGAIIPLKFATKWSSKVGVQMEWDIFDPKRSVTEQQKQIEINKSTIEQARQTEQWKKDATLAYAAVVLASEQYALAVEDSIAYQKILAVVKSRCEEGREGTSEYVQAQQELERKRIALYEAWSVLLDADLELGRYQDLDTTKVLSSNMQDIRQFIQSLQLYNYDLETLKLDQQMNELQQRSLKKELLPTLKLNAYLGEQFYSNEFRLDRGSDWFGNSFVNLALRIPLSSYFTMQPSLKKNSLQQQLTNLQLEEEQMNDNIQSQQKAVKVQAAEKKLAAYQRIDRLALENKETKEKAFHAGRLLLTELMQAHASYNQARKDIWQAEYDLLKITLEN
ncbi:TolC family protein [Sphingobacterium sp.]|uniref:TolC family protein n=1 Tax=Sphingobacterium sp. TaxID=341027 RepID=UPI00289A07E1|nr:TolC family protein [Sphingobacterium sp.]